jgi:fructose/tagatose bisphosphate aldolase
MAEPIRIPITLHLDHCQLKPSWQSNLPWAKDDRNV